MGSSSCSPVTMSFFRAQYPLITFVPESEVKALACFIYFLLFSFYILCPPKSTFRVESTGYLDI